MAGLSPEEAARGRALITGARPTPAPPTVVPKARKVVALDDYIRRVVDAAPPLSAEQAERIAALLRPSAGGAA